MELHTQTLTAFVDDSWNNLVIPELINYIRIPNKSPAFDPNWQEHGHMDRAVAQFVAWSNRQNIKGMQLEVVRLKNRTPLIYMDINGEGDEVVILYGHLDKQPEMNGWRAGLGPWEPVLDGDKLYGRGGADDGYATFASLLAIKALQEQRIPHSRCIVIIEACEESGSIDLPFYIDKLKDRIGNPGLVICLDSGCGNYDQLWNTTSLRGLLGGELKVEILSEGVHSGDASGVVPSSFRILRRLLDRIDHPDSGAVSANKFNVPIPEKRVKQARVAASVLDTTVYTKFPFISGAHPVIKNPTELILNRTWRPALSITGADDLPSIANSGNVLRPKTSVKISLRLPPTCKAKQAALALKELLEFNPPYGAKVTFTPDWEASGWPLGQVVLKVLSQVPDATNSVGLFDRFLQEYELIAELDHPNIVKIHDLGVADDHAHIEMEYLDGGDLRKKIIKGVDEPAAVRYFRQLASALGEIHKLGILHRDLKPGNIMLRRDDSIALIDFGLAKRMRIEMENELTNSGEIFGTPHYMSPEQGHGNGVDMRSDLYSLGIIFFEMLTGDKPFTADSAMGVIFKHAKAAVPMLPRRVSQHQALLNMLLAKDPDNRLQTAEETLEWM